MIFYKYHGTGNDFIIIDNRANEIQLTTEDIQHLCKRHTGIGADGCIMIENHETADFYMDYYNSNGKKSSMCGNGARCVTLFAKQTGIINNNKAIFAAVDGLHLAHILENGDIAIKMEQHSEITLLGKAFIIDTGSPHYVRFSYNVDALNVKKEGNIIRNSAQFKREGINVNFVEETSNGLFLRTYERGVEDETLSCGTGATAAALCFYHKLNMKGDKAIHINTLGGSVKVQIETNEKNEIEHIWLIGPAKEVFIGEVML